ncbi:glycerophosphodiester phosphodiesterase [Pseudoxanthomonas sp. X-1]|uniref:glycerophosphodiester phosphodiesterase n=1 Tax=Pseudoxanthomonas sp. X-1 TaxID=2571115 RepID=UPI00110BBF88|nr:glycerophosphodiester phosphodiesterase [Pseudoxanthomonas sp. X-1]TMN20129.1 glycerophosphodiester phosphodiesterase [Pseudoxanthomonas sp. X-1]UAY75053.1 glycerophosphodiester phosphodiesterase [Pseudoxanthomonas sp. X-1]
MMRSTLFLMACMGATLPLHAAAQDAPMKPVPSDRLLVIGHRGASALRPEHTLASYAKAIADGADYIEPDLVSSKDGALLARHENEIGSTTDVAAHPEFAARQTTKTIDGQTVTGWFTEDFTLAELKTLRARERLPKLRGTAFDGQFQLVTLDEIIDFTAAESAARGRVIGLIPEIKHPTYFQQRGLPMEAKVVTTLGVHAYTRSAPVVIQSFEIANLKQLHGLLGDTHPNVRLVQLIGDPKERPGDVLAAGGGTTYAHMLTPQGLKDIARYAQLLGPANRMLLPLDAQGNLGKPTAIIADAHAAGLKVVPYTFRPENAFLPKDLQQGREPATRSDAGSIREMRAFLDAGVDGFFTDDPALGRQAVDGWHKP